MYEYKSKKVTPNNYGGWNTEDDRLIIEGVNVKILLEQCERLAEPIRASTRSFQFASALDNSAAVIKALLSERAALIAAQIKKLEDI